MDDNATRRRHTGKRPDDAARNAATAMERFVAAFKAPLVRSGWGPREKAAAARYLGKAAPE